MSWHLLVFVGVFVAGMCTAAAVFAVFAAVQVRRLRRALRPPSTLGGGPPSDLVRSPFR